jgi:MFS family permease
MNPSAWKTKLTLLLVSCLTIMSIITISPALPDMVEAFKGEKNADIIVKLILTIPALFIALMAPFAGKWIDKYGRLKFLWVSMIVYGIAGASGFLLNNLWMILLSRAVLGMAVGMSMTIVVTLVADYYEGMERQKFIGLQMAFMSLGGILFIGMGGILADIGWRFPFLLYLLSLILLPLAFVFLQEPVLKKTETQHSILVESPKIIWLLFINIMVIWILFFLIPTQIPFHLNDIGVNRNALIGGAIALSTASAAVSSILYSKIKGRFNFLSIFSLGYFLMAIGFFLVSESTTYLMVACAMIVSGLGVGIMLPNTNLWVMKLAPPEIRGKEIGKLTMFWFFGQFISPILLLPITNHYDLPITFQIMAFIMLGLSTAAFILTRIPKIAAFQ